MKRKILAVVLWACSATIYAQSAPDNKVQSYEDWASEKVAVDYFEQAKIKSAKNDFAGGWLHIIIP